jgi:hypothetical protein
MHLAKGRLADQEIFDRGFSPDEVVIEKSFGLVHHRDSVERIDLVVEAHFRIARIVLRI